MNPTYKPGDIVFGKNPSNLKLVIQSFSADIYTCRVYNHPSSKQVYCAEEELRKFFNPTD